VTFDLFIRGSGRGFLRKFARGFTESDLERALSGGPEKERKGDTWRITRPDTGEPWFVAYVRDGEIVLSTSYANHRYLANCGDMFDAGLTMADRVGGDLFDEFSGTSLHRGGALERLLAPSGEYIKLQTDTFRMVREQLAGHFAGLEWPSGPFDHVSQYCVFRVLTAKPPPPLAECLSQLEWPYSVHSDNTASLGADHDSQVVIGLVLRREDQSLQIWPTYATASFERCATRCRDVALHLADEFEGSVEFNREPLTGTFADEINTLLTGYGTDLYEWLHARHRRSSSRS
jgi:hypothetical protein